MRPCCLHGGSGGSTTHPLDSFSSPLGSATRTTYFALPDRASLVRNATAPVLDRAVAPAGPKTARKPGALGIGGSWVTTFDRRKTDSDGELASQATLSPVNTREGSQILPAPKTAWRHA